MKRFWRDPASSGPRQARRAFAMFVLGVAATCGATSASPNGDGSMVTHTYTGTRDVRHVTDAAAGSSDANYHGVFDVEASRTSTRTGTTVIETETRVFAVRSGGYRSDAAIREVLVFDERLSGTGDEVVLDEFELDRATFGYLAPAPTPVHVIRGQSPFDGTDREWTVETYETPPLVYAVQLGTHANAPARSITTSISDAPRDPSTGSIDEQVFSDGSVHGRSQDFVVQKSFEQHADGSGHSNDSATGFSSVDRDVSAAKASPSDNTDEIAVTQESTGREIGPPPYPIAKASYVTPDWYPGGRALPNDTDVVTSSGPADTRVPAPCGAASRGRFAHDVIRHRSWTRITGITEADSDETYWAGRTLLCEIERRHTETYDLTSGKRIAADDKTTTLGIVQR